MSTAVSDIRDLIIIGSGPAGYTAAVYAARANLAPLVFEGAVTAGGALMNTTEVENFPGFADGIMGPDLMQAMRAQAERFGAELVTDDVTEVSLEGPVKTVTDGEGQVHRAHAVILAMGVEYRQLPAEGCEILTGAGVYYGATTSVASECDDDEVYVIGGANSAGQAAMFLSRTAKSVTIVSRRTLEDSMSHYLVQQIRAQDNIKEMPNTVVHAVKGDGHLEGICLEHRDTGEREEFACGRMFIFIGAEPRTDWLDGVVVRDGHGFIVAGPDLRDVSGWTLDRPPHHLETSVPGVFVAGDVRAESAKRVAAAVGEGSMAVMLVHRYLAET